MVVWESVSSCQSVPLFTSSSPFNFRAGCKEANDVSIWWGLDLPGGRQWSADGVVLGAGDEQLLRGKSGDDFVAGRGHDDFLFDAGSAPAISRRPERLQRKYHPRLDLLRMIEGNETADNRLLPDGEADSMTVLQSESRLFIGKAEVLRPGPDGRDFARASSRADQFDGRVKIIAAS